MPVSDDVWRLVRKVERLPIEDQEKIIRMVGLLPFVPRAVMDRTQRLLRELLEQKPNTRLECVARVDDLLDYLERNAASGSKRHDAVARIDFTALQSARSS